MTSIALLTLVSLQAKKIDDIDAAMEMIPAWQWRISGGHFAELSKFCGQRIDLDVERRPANALNVEIGSPLPRCRSKAPDGRGDAWLLSGGSPLAHGLCVKHGCYWCDKSRDESRANVCVGE